MGSACPTCGVRNSDGARHCTACGTDLRESHCPECRSVVPEDARFCPSCAAPLPHPEASEERKLVTVLFADVTGSTALGERLDPERFRAVLRAYHAMASAAIRSWGGTVEKYIGDAVMAVFGVPVMREDDAERALEAAQAILERLVPLNRALEEQHAVTLTLRIGINTGDVIAPSEGVDAQLVAGDAVNVASRLEHSAEPGTVLVGDRTYTAARGSHGFVGPMELQVAGKREPVRAWRLVGRLSEAQRGIPGLHAPMVGRGRELDAVTVSLREAVEVERPRMVVIYGPAGIGKSRLVQESLREMRREHSTLRVLRGRCLSAGPGIGFWPLAEILREACGISLDEPAEVAGAKVARTVRDVVGRLGEPEAEIQQTTHALATTAGLALPDNPLDRADPPMVASELARAWPRFATALANERPTVLVVEDLHWASEELVTMLQRVAGRSSGPLLLLATARPEFADSHAAFAVAREDVTILTLRPLNGAQTEQLADELLARTGVPDEVRSILHERAQGNPFFLEEILRGLIDDGILVRSGDGWRPTTGILPDQVPDSVHALLAARIDALPREEKRLLQEAAVVGRIFWEGPLRAAGAGPDIGGILERLESKGLVVARPTSTISGETEYIFKHALVRDVAYAGLPRARSVRSHASVARWMEESAPDRRDEFIELVAHHYGAAAAKEDAGLAWASDASAREEVRRRAVRALLDAGNLARHRYALDVARERHQSALSLATTDDERAEAWEALGDDEEAAFHGDEAWAGYASAAAIKRTREPSAIGRLAWKAARVTTRVGTFRDTIDPTAVEQFVDEGLATTTDEEVRARLLIEKGSHLREMWEAVTGEDPYPAEERAGAIGQAAAIAARLKIPDLELAAEEGLGGLRWSAHDYDAAVASSRRQLDLVERVESPAVRALTLYQASITLRDTAGEFTEGLELARRSYELAKRLSPHELMHATAQWMITAYWLGRWDEMDPLLAEHLAVLAGEADRSCSSVRSGPAIGALVRAQRGDEAGAREALAVVDDRVLSFGMESSGGLAALAYLELAQPDEALRRCAKTVATHRRAGSAFVGVAFVETLAAMGAWERLTATLPTSRALAKVMKLLGPVCDRAEGRMQAERGEHADALRLLEAALDGFEALGLPFEAARTRERLASLAAPDAARALLESSLATYRDLRAAPHADRVRSLLG